MLDFQGFKAVTTCMKCSSIFRYIMLCSPMKINRCFPSPEKKKLVCFGPSKTSVDFHRTTQHYNPEVWTPQSRIWCLTLYMAWYGPTHFTFRSCSTPLFRQLLLYSVALVRKGTIPIERQPLVGELVPTLADRECIMGSATNPHGR
jgi:hypothetical protein